MPGMDAVEFVARLRGHRDQDEQPTPVIAVTPSPTSTRASALRTRLSLVLGEASGPARVALEVPDADAPRPS
jgi:CheY-like chemotaxis protein